jgi:hypothetical protein
MEARMNTSVSPSSYVELRARSTMGFNRNQRIHPAKLLQEMRNSPTMKTNNTTRQITPFRINEKGGLGTPIKSNGIDYLVS